MKLTKRLILAVLCIALVLTSTLLVVTACDQEETGFKVTVEEYNNKQGTVSVSEPKEGKLYDEGEKVTVTVTPATDYEVASFVVSGHSDATMPAGGGSCSFDVTADTTVTVTFQPVVPKKDGTVTVYYDDEFVSVKLEPQAENDHYAGGTEVTLTVTTPNGYGVSSIYAGNSEVHLVDGKYTFVVDGDVTFNINIQQVMTNELLESAQGSVVVSGTQSTVYLWDGEPDGEPMEAEVSTVFDAKNHAIWQTEYDFMGDLTYFKVLTRDVDGKGATVSHGTDGKLVLTPTAYDFDELFNPFDYFNASDFVYFTIDQYEIADAEKATVAARALTGYLVEVESFYIFAEEGKIARIEITCPVQDGFEGEQVQISYSLELSEQGTASVPADWLGDYTETAEHAQLRSALDKLAGNSYTQHIDRESDFASDEVAYYTDNGIQIHEVLFQSYSGYAKRSDGVIWHYTTEDGEEFSFDMDPISYSDFASVKAILFDNVNLGVFQSKGEGVFELRDVDCFDGDRVANLSATLGAMLGTGPVYKSEWRQTISIVITLTGDNVSIELTTGGYEGETVTISFEGIDSTTLPLTVSSSVLAGEFDDDLIGTWVNDDASYRVKVTPFGIYINNVAVYNLKYTFGSYIFDWDQYDFDYGTKLRDVAFYEENGTKYLAISDDEIYELHFREYDWVDFAGEWFGTDREGNECAVVIDKNGIQITVNGEEWTATDLVFHEDFGVPMFFLEVNGESAVLQKHGQERLDLHDGSTGGSLYEFILAKEGYVSDWSMLYGTYRNEDGSYEIVVDKDGIHGTINGTPFVAEFLDFDMYGNVYGGTMYQFDFYIDDIPYCMQQIGAMTYKFHFVNVKEGEATMQVVTLSTYTLDLTPAKGHYTGTDPDGKKYDVTVTESGLVITVDGVAWEITNIDITLAYSSDGSRIDWQISFNANGRDYLMDAFLITGDRVLIYNAETEEELFDVVVNKDGYTVNSDRSNYVGEYTGTLNFYGAVHKYVVVITNDSIEMTVDGNKLQLTVIDFNDPSGFMLRDSKNVYYYIINVDGTLYLLDTYYGNSGEVELSEKKEEPPVSDCEWARLIGGYGAVQDGKVYAVDISATGVKVTLEGKEYTAEIVEYDDAEGYFEVKVNGEDYIIMDTTYRTDPKKSVTLVTPDYKTLNVLLPEAVG